MAVFQWREDSILWHWKQSWNRNGEVRIEGCVTKKRYPLPKVASGKWARSIGAGSNFVTVECKVGLYWEYLELAKPLISCHNLSFILCCDLLRISQPFPACQNLRYLPLRRLWSYCDYRKYTLKSASNNFPNLYRNSWWIEIFKDSCMMSESSHICAYRRYFLL